MYILDTITQDKIWGDKRLKSYGATSNQTGLLFSCSADSPIKNTTLGELIKKEPAKFGLLPGEEYPIMISFDSVKEDVSMQVHPTDAYAQAVENRPYGKCEAWYFIEEPEKGWVYAENKEETKAVIEQALKQHDFSDAVRQYPVKKEDLLFTPAGTIHCLTHGSLVYEIQQSTNITYRLYDYDRPRELHIKQALETMIPSNKEIKQRFGLGSKASFYAFDLEHKHITNELSNPSDIASVCTLLSGRILIEHTLVNAGTSILLMPKETVCFDGDAQCIFATPNPYWRE